MSVDAKLDENGNPDITDGSLIVNGIEELKQSLSLRLKSQVGWAKDDDDFGVEWLGFFDDVSGGSIAEQKIREAIEHDPRVNAVTDIELDIDDSTRTAHVKTMLNIIDQDLIDENGNPNLDYEFYFEP